MPVGFQERLVNAAQDQIIDRREWQELRALGQRAIDGKHSDDWIARHTLNYLDQFKGQTRIQYGIPGQTLNFSFTPAYSELDSIPGNSPAEIVSHISQSDNLPETTSDNSRCGAASLLNAWLLLGGRFEDAAGRLGLSASQRDLTYQNMHLAQDALYQRSNTNGRDGLTSGLSFTHSQGQILSVTLDDEIQSAIQLLGLKAQPLSGDSVADFNQRRGSVGRFIARNPFGVLLTGIHLDTQSGELKAVSRQHPMNHFVVIHRQGGAFYLVDTGASDNGVGNSRRQLSADEVERFVYNTPAHVIGLTR